MFVLNLPVIILLSLTFHPNFGIEWETIDLPEEHLSYYFNNYPQLIEQCSDDEKCPYKEFLASSSFDRKACWGYEPNCRRENAINKVQCLGDHTGFVSSKDTQIDTFYHQTDFGYIKDQINGMRIMCEPIFHPDSSLECNEYLRFCRGRNLMLNLTDLIHRQDPYRYKIDVLKEGQIGGYCELYEKRLQGQADHVSALQSWAPEMRFFKRTTKRPLEEEGFCDVVVEKPTYLMKIDASINMYHHFCDFFNLYASLHMNNTHIDAWKKDFNILIWETFTYESPFEETFKAFTSNPILDLKHFKGKVVCFKHLVMPLLPRMIFGLYYNTPIIAGCEKSALFQSFSEFILHRMRIPFEPPKVPKIRVTFLSRKTKYRNILNEQDLYDEIKDNPEYDVRRVSYGPNLTFHEQLTITRNSDVFIGMHGAGLTHLLFLPNWATIFELYHCGDPGCYRDLARLRGVHYLTWENASTIEAEDEGHHPEGGAHPKFTNYSFDPKEFARMVAKAAQHVKEHEEYQKYVEETNQLDDITEVQIETPVKDIHDEL
ncbi:EGF domain-specific O-linked N-acetylglucosamine transferase [Culicoides brevitarsis]|uniref:EGF domain-specific O-linked N-acetylglucosamine transferase n=1 Tax=Culicoides brevitarsis TaxID=469753 RepID=UPI00307BC013